MKKLFPKLRALEQKIASEKGEITLYAIFLRDAGRDSWDLVVSGPWADPEKFETFEYLAQRLHDVFTLEERRHINAVLPLQEDNYIVKAILDEVSTEKGIAEIRDEDFDGFEVRKAYIFTVKRKNEGQPVAAGN
jgi:hypothetical protein